MTLFLPRLRGRCRETTEWGANLLIDASERGANTLTIREANDEDRPAILAVIEAAFARADEAAIVEKLWADDAISLDIVATIGGEIVGHCAFSPLSASPPLSGALIGMAPVAVAPAHQKKGVGAAMIETGVDTCRMRGARLIAVLGAPAYYSRFGFTPASARNICWDAVDAGEAFRLITFAAMDDAPPRTLRYHDAFYG